VFYSLTPGACGHGCATEAAHRVIGYAVGPLGLTEVFAEVDEGNRASAAVIERVGMTAFTTVPGVLGPLTRYRKTRF
jgi:[ribosomal protein S5]-alanine N-acetyltransferase